MRPTVEIAQRVGQLEREIRRWRILAIAGSCLLLLSVLAGLAPATIQSEIRSQRFIVTDAAGNRRAELGVTESGVPALYLAGSDGVDRVWLEVAHDAPA